MKEYAREITLAVKKDAGFKAVTIKSAEDAYNFASGFYGDDIDLYESMFIILMNASGRTLGWAKVSQGGLDSTVIDKRIVAKYAIESLATSVIVVHNHPSGNVTPSAADITQCKQVREGLRMFDISMLDSIILGGNKYYSFAEEREFVVKKKKAKQ